MSAKSARREYLEAVAAFDRACLRFSTGMASALAEPAAAANVPMLSPLGPRKGPKRAQPRLDQAATRRMPSR